MGRVLDTHKLCLTICCKFDFAEHSGRDPNLCGKMFSLGRETSAHRSGSPRRAN